MKKSFKRCRRLGPAPSPEDARTHDYAKGLVEAMALDVDDALGTGNSQKIDQYLAQAKAPQDLAKALLKHAKKARAIRNWEPRVLEEIEIAGLMLLDWRENDYWSTFALITGSELLRMLEADA